MTDQSPLARDAARPAVRPVWVTTSEGARSRLVRIGLPAEPWWDGAADLPDAARAEAEAARRRRDEEARILDVMRAEPARMWLASELARRALGRAGPDATHLLRSLHVQRKIIRIALGQVGDNAARWGLSAGRRGGALTPVPEDAVLALLRRSSVPVTGETIAVQLGVHPAPLGDTLRRLARAGRVAAVERKRGRLWTLVR